MNKLKFWAGGLILFLIIPACLLAQPGHSVNGWLKSEEIKTYSAETLWDYINGAADYFLTYNFSELEVTEYFRSEDEYIKVEIYNHGDRLNAFGIYAYERPPDVEYLDLGSEAYRIHSSLNFYCSHYYVKILSHQSDTNTLETILKLAEMVAGQFKEEEGGVSMLRMLPQENRISHTEKFFPENYLGYSFLIQAVEAEYKSGEERYKMFVITQATKEDIHKVLNSYLKFTGTDIDIAIEEGKVINIEDIFHGKVFLLTWNNCLYGIFDTENKDLAFKILNKLQNQ